VGVLLLTTVLPGGRQGGGEIVTQGVVDALRHAGRDVRVLGYRRRGDPGTARPGEVCVGHRAIETSSAGVRSLAWMTRALARGTPYSVEKYRSRSYLRALREALREGAEAVIVDHAQASCAIPRSGRLSGPLIFIAHNAEGEAYARLAADGSGPVRRWANSREGRLIQGVEAKLARRADQVWTLTAADAEYFRSLHPGADVRTLEVASGIAEPTGGGAPAYDIALIGTWSWRANAAGLDWFSTEVVPRLPARLVIEVAGPDSERIRGRHPNVAVRGIVPDAQRFLSKARVIAVPAVAGGGVQVKTLDAIGSGAPVVATRTAVRGLGDLPASVAVADSAAAFAEQLRRFVLETDHEGRRAEANAWLSARRERFEVAVASWTAELIEGEGHLLEGRGAPA
jgi:polysaccharide biosynthesis protein PslH